MTEEEFLTSADPARMLSWLILPSAGVLPELGMSTRKLRLFACACCRASWEWLRPVYNKRIINVAEMAADGKVPFQDVRNLVNSGGNGACGRCLGRDCPKEGAREIISAAQRCQAGILPAFADLLRDIVGNPWKPIKLCCPQCPIGNSTHCETWKRVVTSQVFSLAEAAYEERGQEGALDPLRLMILADALEEAGCTEERLLGHLRGPGRHYRGCWALDCVLGRE